MPLARPIEAARTDVAPRPISSRLRTQLVYFALPMSPAEAEAGEFAFDLEQVERVEGDGVIALISPLDTANMTEVELSEEQEVFLRWLLREKVRRIRIEDA